MSDISVSKVRTPLMGFAMLWIMCFHAGLDVPVLKVLWSGGYGGVDLFLFLSSYGLYRSMKRNVGGTGLFLKKRLLRILPGYYVALFFWFLVGGSWDWTALLQKVSMLGFYIPPLRWDFFLWYVPGILLLYLMFPFLYKNRARFERKGTVLLLIASVLLLNALLVCWIDAHDYNKYGLLLLVPRIPVFVFGLIWADKEDVIIEKIADRKKLFSQLVVLMLVAYAFILGSRYWMPELQRSMFMLAFFPFVFVLPGIAVLFVRFYDSMPAFLKGVLVFCGTYSLELYLVHQDMYAVFPDLAGMLGINRHLMFAVVFLMCFPMAFLLSKTVKGLMSLFNKPFILSEK